MSPFLPFPCSLSIKSLCNFFLVRFALVCPQYDLKTIKKVVPIHVNNLTEKNIYQKRGQLMTPATYKKDTKFCFFCAFHFVSTRELANRKVMLKIVWTWTNKQANDCILSCEIFIWDYADLATITGNTCLFFLETFNNVDTSIW